MRIITIEQKQSNSGSIHDLASDTRDRDIKIPATAGYVIILAAYYGGKGYSTHATAESAARKVKSLKKDNTSFEVFDADGSYLEWDGCDFRVGDPNRDIA
jgi:hypothetical protein